MAKFFLRLVLILLQLTLLFVFFPTQIKASSTFIDIYNTTQRCLNEEHKNFPFGTPQFNGVYFKVRETCPNLLETQVRSYAPWVNFPTSVTYETSINSPKEIHILFSGGDVYEVHRGKKVAVIRVEFNDQTKMTEEVFAGYQLRNWILDNPETIHTTSSSKVIEAWSGYTVSDNNGPVVIDHLKINVPLSYQSKKITKISIQDVSLETMVDYSPSIKVFAVTVLSDSSPPTGGAATPTPPTPTSPPTPPAPPASPTSPPAPPAESTPTPTSPPPTPTPTPALKPVIVFIPGHGGSWNTKKFLYEINDENDWRMTPMVHLYDNLIQTITNSGYSNGQDFFVFHYDWRKSTSESAERLKNKINGYLNGKPSGTKVNIVAHSYGGLVGRDYLQKNSGAPVDKFLTVGTPHLGLVDTYGPWEGGEVWKNDFWQWLGFETLLRYYQTRDKIISAREAAQKVSPSLKDLLPSFDFLRKNGSLVAVSSMNQKNTLLLSNPFGPPFGNSDFTNLVGANKNTLKEITVVDRRWYDKIIGDWEDGLPIGFDYGGNGDGAVLTFSSEIAPETYELSQNHGEIVSSSQSLEIIKNILGLTGGISTNAQNPKNGLVFALHSPAKLRITSPDGNYQIGDSISLPQIPNSLALDDNKMVFIEDPSPGTYAVEIIGYEQAEYSLDVLRIRENQPAKTQTFKSNTYPGNIQLLYYDYSLISKESPLKNAEVIQETANFEDDLRLLQFDLLFAPGPGERSPANRQMLVMLNTTYSHRLQNAKNLIAKNQKLKALNELQSAYNTLNNTLVLAARQRKAGLLSENSALIYSQKITELARKLQLFYIHLAEDINFAANKIPVQQQMTTNSRLIDNLDKRLSTKTNYLTAWLFKEAVKEKALSEDALNRDFYNSALLQTQLALILAQSASISP